MNKNINNKDVEVLAPAGSYDIMKAVINAGADAVYLGGDMFGARAYAGNFNEDELLRTIDYAHVHDKKIYLTVNTLLKERELEEQLVKYLLPYYKEGLDAVIVQDMGVLRVIHENFPDMHIHASTQMTITGSYGASILEKCGTSRIVTARELNLGEIKKIREKCDIEIESFVHGALCYCYSGQCLFSSMNGGRSGNRGRCAQPCRMPYDVFSNDGGTHNINNKNEKYSLSPKDMCTLKILPDIIEAGVYSLKIEGRMKNIIYAAGVTQMYRKYVDRYLQYGKEAYSVDENDVNRLMDIYNRGMFTTGYYNNSKGRDMLSISRPNHMGTKALRVISNNNGFVTFEAFENIDPHDVFEIDADNSFTSGEAVKKGGFLKVNLPKKYKLNKGRILYRTKSETISQDITDKCVKNNIKRKINVIADITEGKNAVIRIEDAKDPSLFIEQISDDIVSTALKQPLSEEKVLGQINRFGDTEFEPDTIKAVINGSTFVPVKQLNELRRNAVNSFEQKLIGRFRRKYEDAVTDINISFKRNNNTFKSDVTGKCVYVKNSKQVKLLYNDDSVEYIYFDFDIFGNIRATDRNSLNSLEHEENSVQKLLKECHAAGKKAVIALPYILREKNHSRCEKLLRACGSDKDAAYNADAFLVRNVEEIGLISEMYSKEIISVSDVITDANLYTWNEMAVKELHTLITSCGLRLLRCTLPFELTSKEISSIGTKVCDVQRELIVYARIPLMVSEQCLYRTFNRCRMKTDGNGGISENSGEYKINTKTDNKLNTKITMKARNNTLYNIENCCDYCYSLITDERVFDITDMTKEIQKIKPDYIRYEFIETDDVYGVVNNTLKKDDSYRGHFVLGVE